MRPELLQCGQDQQDGHIDLYDEFLVVAGEDGGHLAGHHPLHSLSRGCCHL